MYSFNKCVQAFAENFLNDEPALSASTNSDFFIHMLYI